MATILDIGLLELFKPAITFIFVWAILMAILLKTKLLGDNVGLNLLAALGGALMFLLTPGVVEVVNIMTPWFVVLFDRYNLSNGKKLLADLNGPIIAKFRFLGVKISCANFKIS